MSARGSPRIRDFRGLAADAVDGRGNYNLGLKDQLVFPEIIFDEIQLLKGMQITIVTTAATDEQGRAFLRAYGFPFRQENK